MMFYRALQIFLNFFTIFYCVTGETLTKNNEKRVGIRNNYQMCLDSFDIRRDKIIRTHDSRDLGAKYLTEIDVDSRDECLKYCCDTEGCDVFIFEEKKPGSCYLFECGPLNNFKCKFTSHANYSSAVRTNYNNVQNNVRQEDELRVSQQEHELKSLRKVADTVNTEEFSFTEQPMKLIVTSPPKLVLTAPPPVTKACSRNQYECRSSGDCIAIYNVCDGIPQCADGSDEAAELGCPTEKPTTSSLIVQGLPQQQPVPPPLPPLPPPLPANIIKYQQIVDEHKALVPLYAHGPVANSKPWELPNLQQQVVPQQQSLLYPAQQMEMSQFRKGFGVPGYQWDYQPMYDRNKDPYNPANSYRNQNNAVPYEQDQPHIFNHKGLSVVEEKEGGSGVYLEQKHPYVSHFSSSDRGSWQDTRVLPSSSVIPNLRQKEMHEVDKSVVSTTAPPCDEGKHVLTKSKEINKPIEKVEKHVFREKVTASQDSVMISTLKNEVPKYNHIQGKELKEHKGLIVIEDHSREHTRNNIIAEHIKHGNENKVLRPRGAVISLALGLTITAITAALIACRLRVVRRRGRRHGPYAHDADYLVNGMYL